MQSITTSTMKAFPIWSMRRSIAANIGRWKGHRRELKFIWQNMSEIQGKMLGLRAWVYNPQSGANGELIKYGLGGYFSFKRVLVINRVLKKMGKGYLWFNNIWTTRRLRRDQNKNKNKQNKTSNKIILPINSIGLEPPWIVLVTLDSHVSLKVVIQLVLELMKKATKILVRKSRTPT